MFWSRFKRILLGEPLTSQHLEHQLIPKWKALATLSSDALSSVAYATAATLAVLVAYSVAAAFWSVPIALAITGLLVILTLSYRQTISAYPSGGGAYTVAKENLGVHAGLVAGTALLIDYVLTVAVSVAAGIENIASAFPFLFEHRVLMGIIIIAVIMLLNLRGIRESSTVFAFPTYFFIISIFVLLGTGFWRVMHGQITPSAPLTPGAFPAVPLILILRAFGSGCAALTGVEAISNGVAVFRAPAARNAKITMIWMSVLLGGFFLGISALSHFYGITPKEDQTVISLLGRSVFDTTIYYYLLQTATALILFLAANTSYADFPRLASLLARDGFVPRQLASQGDRLVFSNGIFGLSLVAALVIVLFGGSTLHMIPLYAIGVFLSFTLSQAGMVVHHLRKKESGWLHSLIFNAIGALTTLVVLCDLSYTKFLHGAWIVVLAIPILVFLFSSVHAHYLSLGKQLSLTGKIPWQRPLPLKHTVIIPISGLHIGILEALRYAITISTDVRACYVDINATQTEQVKEEWQKWAAEIPFVIVKSPYRSIIQPLLNYIDDICQTTHDDLITVLIPEFVTTRWWHRFLHNQTALLIRASLASRPGVVVTSMRIHLGKGGVPERLICRF